MLTEKEIQNGKAKGMAAKPQGTAYKLADGQGLYLYVSTTGAKSWRFDYRHGGKRYTLTHGPYPEVASGEARDRHMLARKALERGEDPALVKQRVRRDALAAAGDTFKAIAEIWFEGKSKARSAAWADNVRRWLDRNVYPAIGARIVREIRPADILAVMQTMQADGMAKSAEYMRQVAAQVFDFAIANLKTDSNPARLVRGAIHIPPPKSRPPLAEKEIPAFLDALDAYPGRLPTKLAAKLLLLTFTRKLELIEAKRDEIDIKAAEWRIPSGTYIELNGDYTQSLNNESWP